jgi:hypothetical protein
MRGRPPIIPYPGSGCMSGWGTPGASKTGRGLYARFARGPFPVARLLASLEGTHETAPPMPGRTIRKPTRWTPDEWRQIEEFARARGVPPLRYVREAALAGKLPPLRTRRSRAHELVRQLKRVLNNLHQLARVAEEEGADAIVTATGSTIRFAEHAVRAAASRPDAAVAPLIGPLVEAGQRLNEVAHLGNGEGLPPDEDVAEVLARVQVALLPLFT